MHVFLSNDTKLSGQTHVHVSYVIWKICWTEFFAVFGVDLFRWAKSKIWLSKTVHCSVVSDSRASTRQNLSSGFPTKSDSNQSAQLQWLAKKLKFRL